jgi:tetratricopeptide (TPR) repeat protein
VVHHKNRRFSEAKQAYHEVLRLKPNLAQAWAHVGALYCEQGQLDKGVKAYQRAIRLRPGFLEAWHGLGRAAAAAGDAALQAEVRRYLEGHDGAAEAPDPAAAAPRPGPFSGHSSAPAHLEPGRFQSWLKSLPDRS